MQRQERLRTAQRFQSEAQFCVRNCKEKENRQGTSDFKTRVLSGTYWSDKYPHNGEPINAPKRNTLPNIETYSSLSQTRSNWTIIKLILFYLFNGLKNDV